MPKSLRSLRAGGGGVLVTHGATLRCSGRSERYKQQRKTESQKHGRPNWEANLHCISQYIKSPNGAAALGTATRAELQRLKPILISAHMSWLKPRPTKIKRCPDGSELVRPHIHQSDAVREEHDQHHANAEYHGWNEEKKQTQALEAQVHEVGHDQGGLNE